MKKVSRRELARTVTSQLLSGADQALLVRQLAAYLVERKMTNQLDMLIEDIAQELQAQTGHVTASVTTAFEPSAETLTQIKQTLLSLTNASTAELNVSVDPHLLGGVVVALPGQELDASIRRKLTSLA